MADLGKIVYQRYKEEVPVDDAQKALCEQIDQRMEQIEQLRTDINELKIRTRRSAHPAVKKLRRMLHSANSVVRHVRHRKMKRMPVM